VGIVLGSMEHRLYNAAMQANASWLDALDRLTREFRKPNDADIFAQHMSALISLHQLLKRLTPPSDGELAAPCS
jgi:hypothetical protein